MAISKSELLRLTKEIIVSEGYAVPLYMNHILLASEWYGFSSENEAMMRDVLSLIRAQMQTQRKVLEEMYRSIQQRHVDMF